MKKVLGKTGRFCTRTDLTLVHQTDLQIRSRSPSSSPSLMIFFIAPVFFSANSFSSPSLSFDDSFDYSCFLFSKLLLFPIFDDSFDCSCFLLSELTSSLYIRYLVSVCSPRGSHESSNHGQKGDKTRGKLCISL